MDPAAFGWFGLVSAGKPVDIFTWAVSLNEELGSAHILEFDLNRIAAIHGTKPLMKGAGGDNVPRIQPNESA
jgi:hypothetical protein